jgi:opacity protein-like surface antigen
MTMTKGKFHEYQSQFLPARCGARVGSRACLVRSRHGGRYDVPPPPPTDRGIYFKGYVGAADANVGSIWTETFDVDPFTVHHKDIKSTPLFGIGVGWQARHWLRFDLTGEYRGDGLFIAYDQAPGTNTNEYTADIKSWLGLVNAYIDMGNWCGFTPFIGAGIGFASLTVEGMKDVNVVAGGGPGSVAFGVDKTNTNFAYAFYAGVAFDVTAQTVIDLSYRYSDLGTAQSGVVTTYDGAASISGVHVRDITSNDLMLGVRYKLQREAVVYQPVK